MKINMCTLIAYVRTRTTLHHIYLRTEDSEGPDKATHEEGAQSGVRTRDVHLRWHRRDSGRRQRSVASSVSEQTN